MSLAALPGVAGTSSMPNTWVVVSIAFFLSDSKEYSRLFHPDQLQKCKLKFTPVCPIFADDAQPERREPVRLTPKKRYIPPKGHPYRNFPFGRGKSISRLTVAPQS